MKSYGLIYKVQATEYSACEDIDNEEDDDKECNCDNCVGHSDDPYNEANDEEMEDVCDIEYDYPEDYYTNYTNYDDSPSD